MGEAGITAPAGSALAGLRKAREKALQGLHLDLRVPGLDPPVFVRYRPVQQFELDEVNDRAAVSKDADRIVIANATVLARACEGIFGIVDGKPDGTPDSWPRFDADLAELLGMPPETTSVELVRALYLIDGAVIGAAEKLNAWSFPAVQSREDENAGN